MDMQVKTLVKIILYIIIAILYYICISWIYNNPQSETYVKHWLDNSIMCWSGILICTMSWLIPLIAYIEIHWDDDINLNKFKW